MNSNSKQKYIIVKGAGGGGLGDRIRCVLSGVVYAKLTGRVLFVDWSDGKLIPDSRNIFNELFSFTDTNFVSKCPVSDDVWPLAWRGRLDESLDKLYTEFDPQGWDRKAALQKFSFNQTKLDYPAQTLVMWDFDQFADLACLSDNEPLKLAQQLTQKHLKPSVNIRTLIDDFKAKTFAKDEQTIGVHIRATNEFDLIKSSVSFDQYDDAVNRALKNTSSNVKIFLATDNVDVESALRQKFPDKVITRKKWFAKAGERLHLNDDCPEPERALIDALVEMLLLAECDYLIYQQNSSFGRCAHIFSEASEDRITPLFVRQSIRNRVKNKVSDILKSKIS